MARVKTTVTYRGEVYREGVVFAQRHGATFAQLADLALAVYLRAVGVELPPALEDVRLPELVPATALPRPPEAAAPAHGGAPRVPPRSPQNSSSRRSRARRRGARRRAR